MKKLNFLQQASVEQKEVAEKLLQSISFVENRNTVTKFLTNFEQVILEQIVAYNYSDFKIKFFGGYNDAEKKKAKIISNEYYDVDYDIVCLKAKFNNKFNKIEHRNNFERVELADVAIEKKYEDFEIVSSSFRLDSIVAKITNKSRSKVKEFLDQDFIKLNHVTVRNGEKNCAIQDIISIRKYGRFVIKEYKQNKKSLKYRITISKLI